MLAENLCVRLLPRTLTLLSVASTLALMGNRIGVPTRVVMGAITPGSGPVRGRDVHAWVEVRDSPDCVDWVLADRRTG